MGFKKLVVAEGTHETRTLVKARDNGTETLVKDIQEIGRFTPKTFDRPFATVGMDLTATQSLFFQSVSTRVSISVPCDMDKLDDGVRFAANFCEQRLAERAEYMAEILDALAEVRQRRES